MEVGSPEWIEASLAHLDDLERERAEHEDALETTSEPLALREHTEALARLDEEIKSLYSQLEDVAEDDPDEEDDVPQATQGDEELSAPHVAAAAVAAPEPEPEPEPAPAPVAAAPVAAAVSEPMASPTDNPFGSPSPAPVGFDNPAPVSFDDDLKPKGGGAKWVFLALVVLGGVGVGGYFVWSDMQAKKAAEASKTPDQPAMVIKAADVPDDTEAPPTAPGGTATISPNAMPTDGKKKKKKKEEEDKPKPLKLKGGDGPL